MDTKEKYKILDQYHDTPKGKEFVSSLKLWCTQMMGIHASELPMFLMCVVKIPTLDFDYDEVYRDLVERGYLALVQHKVPIPKEE